MGGIKDYVLKARRRAVGGVFLAFALAAVVCAVSLAGCSDGRRSGGAAEEEAAKHTNTVTLRIKCDENWIFSKYDLDIYVDDSLVGTLDHGKEKSYTLDLEEGSHTLEIAKEDDRDVKAEKSFSVSGDTTVECRVSCESSKVNIEDFRVTSDEDESASSSVVETTVDAGKEQTMQSAGSYAVKLHVDCKENALLSTYGLEIYVDGNLVGKLAHGANEDYDLSLATGRHELLVCRDGKNSVKGTHSFTIEGASTVEFEVECKSSRVNIKEPTVTLSGDAATDAGTAESGQNEQATTEQTEQTTADATAETAQPTGGEQSGSGSGGSANDVITVNNNADFEKLVTSNSTDAGWFADAYSGKTVEFDGYIADIAAHAGKSSRWDILIYYGDNGATSGPNFKFSDADLMTLGLKGDTLSNGTNVHVVAKVSSYNKTQDLLFLTPVSMVER